MIVWAIIFGMVAYSIIGARTGTALQERHEVKLKEFIIVAAVIFWPFVLLFTFINWCIDD